MKRPRGGRENKRRCKWKMKLQETEVPLTPCCHLPPPLPPRGQNHPFPTPSVNSGPLSAAAHWLQQAATVYPLISTPHTPVHTCEGCLYKTLWQGKAVSLTKHTCRVSFSELQRAAEKQFCMSSMSAASSEQVFQMFNQMLSEKYNQFCQSHSDEKTK